MVVKTVFRHFNELSRSRSRALPFLSSSSYCGCHCRCLLAPSIAAPSSSSSFGSFSTVNLSTSPLNDGAKSEKVGKSDRKNRKKGRNSTITADQMTYDQLFGAKWIRQPATKSFDDLSPLSQQIWTFYMQNRQTKEFYEQKEAVRKRIEAEAKKLASYPDAKVMMIGSSLNGFGNKCCDLDVTLILPQINKMISEKEDMLFVLTDLQQSFDSASDGFVDGQLLVDALTPILQLKLLPPYADVNVEISALNEVGIRNTHLLYHYAKWDWRVRPLVLIVKHWARTCGINDASKKTLSSYSLELLVIYYLMSGIFPQVVPCLQQKLKMHFSKDLSLELLSFAAFRNDQLPPASRHSAKQLNEMEMGELLIGFLSYYSSHFNFRKEVPSVRCGIPQGKYALITRESKEMSPGMKLGWTFLSVEEPFTRKNASYAVHNLDIFQDIIRIFTESYYTLLETKRLESICNDVFVT